MSKKTLILILGIVFLLMFAVSVAAEERHGKIKSRAYVYQKNIYILKIQDMTTFQHFFAEVPKEVGDKLDRYAYVVYDLVGTKVTSVKQDPLKPTYDWRKKQELEAKEIMERGSPTLERERVQREQQKRVFLEASPFERAKVTSVRPFKAPMRISKIVSKGKWAPETKYLSYGKISSWSIAPQNKYKYKITDLKNFQALETYSDKKFDRGDRVSYYVDDEGNVMDLQLEKAYKSREQRKTLQWEETTKPYEVPQQFKVDDLLRKRWLKK